MNSRITHRPIKLNIKVANYVTSLKEVSYELKCTLQTQILNRRGAKYVLALNKVLIQFKYNVQAPKKLHQRSQVCYNFEKSFNSTQMYPIDPIFFTSKVPSMLHPRTRF
jgi:hypothetical protein